MAFKYAIAFFLFAATLPGLHAADGVGLEQGLLSGEMTDSSVILQARLTRGGRQENGEIDGSAGVGRFELSTNPDFGQIIDTGWLQAKPDYDIILKRR